MHSSVRAFLPLVGDPQLLAAVFEDDPDAWLSEPRRSGASDQWIIALRAGALRRTVQIKLGAPWRAGPTRWRSMSWDPVSPDGEPAPLDRLLPSLDGELGLHAGAGDRATMVIDGHYLPPGGRFGSAVDTVALGRVAQATAESFLAAVAANLTAEVLLRSDHEQAR